MVHAGGIEGWVDDVDLVFKSKTNSADYHDEMNTENYIGMVYTTIIAKLTT